MTIIVVDKFFYKVDCVCVHSGDGKSKKVQGKKKLVNSNKSISWNCIFGSFNLFLCSKIDFWPFLKLQIMEFSKK